MSRRSDQSKHLKATKGPAAETALELMKQLITLSSGVLALSATFIGQFSSSSVVLWGLLVLAWLSLIAAVIAGLDSISAIVKSHLKPDEENWSEGRGRRSASISKYSFVIGLVLFATFALLTMFWSGKGIRPSDQPTYNGDVIVIER